MKHPENYVLLPDERRARQSWLALALSAIGCVATAALFCWTCNMMLQGVFILLELCALSQFCRFWEDCRALQAGAFYFQGNGPFPPQVCKLTPLGIRFVSDREFLRLSGEDGFWLESMMESFPLLPAVIRHKLEKNSAVQAYCLSRQF